MIRINTFVKKLSLIKYMYNAHMLILLHLCQTEVQDITAAVNAAAQP